MEEIMHREEVKFLNLLFCKKLKKLVFVLGLIFTSFFVYGIADFVITEYLHSVQVDQYIRSLNPQNEAELRRAFWESIEYDMRYHTIFSRDWRDIFYMLSEERSDGSGHGTYVTTNKPWATDELCQELLRDAGFTYMHGVGYSNEWSTQERFDAVRKWGNNKKSLITTIVSRLAIGIAATGTIVLFLPYVVIALLFGLILSGRPTLHNVNSLPSGGEQTVEIQKDTGAGNLQLPTLESSAVKQHTFKILLVVLGFVFLRVYVLRRFDVLFAIRNRAPPQQKRREFHMKRFITIASLIFICLLSARAISMAQNSSSVYLQFGNWTNAKGSGASLVHNRPRISFFGFTFLNGDANELLVMIHPIKRSVFSFSVGPVAGLQHEEEGSKPFGGFEVRGKLNFSENTNLSYRFATRHNADQRFFNMWVVGINHSWSQWKAGLFYQPIWTEELLNTRIALNVSKKFSRFTLITECRISTVDKTVTTNIDLEIPVSF